MTTTATSRLIKCAGLLRFSVVVTVAHRRQSLSCRRCLQRRTILSQATPLSASALTAVDKALRGVPGVIALTNEAELVDSIIAALADIEGKVAELEAEVESGTRDDDAP